MENLENKTNEQLLKENEEKYRGLYNSIRDSVLVADLDRNIIDCNPAFYSLFAYTKEEIIGKKTLYIYENEAEYNKLGEALKVHHGDKPFFETVNYKKKSGEIFSGEINVFYLTNDQGKANGFIGLIRDITERKRIEEKLTEEKNKAQQYLDIVDVMLVSVDSEGIVKLINPKGCEILGYSEEEIIGQNWFDNFLPERYRENVKEVSKKVFAGEMESVKYYENEILTKLGNEKLIAWHNAVYKDDKGNIIGTLSSGEDITERKKNEIEIKRSSRIFEDSLNEIFLFDSNTYLFTQVNNAAQQNLGYSMDELRNMTPLDFKPEFTNESFTKLVEPLRKKEKEKIVFETVHQRKDKSLYNVEIHLQLLQFEDENIFTAIILDITKRKIAEKELEKYREQLEELVKERTKEVDEKNKKLADQMKIFVGREMKIIELQNKIKLLQGK